LKTILIEETGQFGVIFHKKYAPSDARRAVPGNPGFMTN